MSALRKDTPCIVRPSQRDDAARRSPETVRRSDYSQVRPSVLREPHRKVFGEGESGALGTRSMRARSPRKVQGKFRRIKAFFLACPRSTRRAEELRAATFAGRVRWILEYVDHSSGGTEITITRGGIEDSSGSSSGYCRVPRVIRPKYSRGCDRNTRDC